MWCFFLFSGFFMHAVIFLGTENHSSFTFLKICLISIEIYFLFFKFIMHERQGKGSLIYTSHYHAPSLGKPIGTISGKPKF